MDESEEEISSADLLDLEDIIVSDELFHKFIQILPKCSEISADMFSSQDLRGIVRQESKLISNHLYVLHIIYLNWKLCRKGNESIPDVIRHSVENIKPTTKENPKLFRNFIQKRLSEYLLKVKLLFIV